jgi:hypothetical protein
VRPAFETLADLTLRGTVNWATGEPGSLPVYQSEYSIFVADLVKEATEGELVVGYILRCGIDSKKNVRPSLRPFSLPAAPQRLCTTRALVSTRATLSSDFRTPANVNGPLR